MTSVVDQEYWDMHYHQPQFVYSPAGVEFKPLFDKFLKPGGTCFEIGCYPGGYLFYLGHTFGYTISGIDATPGVADQLPANAASLGLKVGEFTKGDFFNFRSNCTYDVVCSFGFIEHFTNVEEVIELHLALLKPGGTFVISCPNFRKVQYVLHRLLDAQNLARHHLPAMDLNRWERALLRHGLQIQYKGYWRTADFWSDSGRSNYFVRLMRRTLRRLCKRIDPWLHWPNRYTSPFMICFATKPLAPAAESR